MTDNCDDMSDMEDLMKDQGQGKLALCERGETHSTCGSVTVHFESQEFFFFAGTDSAAMTNPLC